MALNFDLLTYMRFFVLLSPVIFPAMAIFGSLYEGNLKGFLYNSRESSIIDNIKVQIIINRW